MIDINIKKIIHYFKLIGICIYILFMRIKKIIFTILLTVFFIILLKYIIIDFWQFRCIKGYEWNLTMTLYEFLIGFSAVIGALAIVGSGILWLTSKLNKNKTIIKSCLPYIRIGDDYVYPIKSQHEFSQIIREAPLELLRKSSLLFHVKYSSENNNENIIIYKSACKNRYGLFFILKTEKK